MNNSVSLTDTLRSLADRDRQLLLLCLGAALLALTLGVVFGFGTGIARAGFIEFSPLDGYRLMTLHGATVFFYWLYFAQAGLLLVFATVYTEGAEGIAWRPLAWGGLALMIAGFAASGVAGAVGAPLLYDAPPELAGAPSVEVGLFYAGYLLLNAGLLCVAGAAVATAVAPLYLGRSAGTSAIGFASIAFAGLLMVSAVASVNAFFPAARWAFGLGTLPADYSTGWHILFHNMHYLPLMATVLVWYVMVKAVSGVESIFGARFSKIIFATYLVFVPPTSLYHMFLEPGLADAVRVLGSLLSLFISVPTVLMFLVIVASLEAHARAQGGRGLFGWIGMLPWRNPAMAAIGMAVVNLALGGAFSFVLIQERLAPMLSDTFFVPGYFHFLTVGTVTLTFLGAFCYVIPGLTGRSLWRPGLLAKLPYLTTFGLLLFGGAGIGAGYSGLPRRMLDPTYGGVAPDLWSGFMVGVGVGATIMAGALLVYVYGLVRTLIPAGARTVPGAADLPSVNWSGATVGRERAWVGPAAIVLLVAGMALSTILAFETMRALPLLASGGGGH